MRQDEMKNLISTNEVEKLMINIRGTNVLLDRDVAMLYGVETKRINEAVRNNPEKFPAGYVYELNEKEIEKLKKGKENFAVEKFDHKNNFKGM